MAETTCLLNMHTWKQVSGVRIPLSPPPRVPDQLIRDFFLAVDKVLRLRGVVFSLNYCFIRSDKVITFALRLKKQLAFEQRKMWTGPTKIKDPRGVA